MTQEIPSCPIAGAEPEPQVVEILRTCHIIAVVGLSANPERDSYRVARYLQEQGYKIIPVNPLEREVLGERCYPSLSAIPAAVDVVDIFRRSDAVPPIVDEAIAVKAKAVWMQQGVINPAAAEKARQAGLKVVMDRCMADDHYCLKLGR